MIILNLILLLNHITAPYLLVVVTGILFWMLCIASAFYTYTTVQKTGSDILDRTITCFFIINILISFGNILYIMIVSGSINPYTYQGYYQKYFINTGDYIKGLSFDTSTTNALLNAFGLIYFLYRRKYWLSILSMAVLLLAGSNLANILLIVILLLIFFFKSTKEQRSIICVEMIMLIVFMVKISPQNMNYIADKYFAFSGNANRKKPEIKNDDLRNIADSLLTEDDWRKKRSIVYLDSIASLALAKNNSKHTETDRQIDTTHIKKTAPVVEIKPPGQNESPEFYERKKDLSVKQELFAITYDSIHKESVNTTPPDNFNKPGKVIAAQQLFQFLYHHPSKWISGNGVGNFSSKLAFKATGLNIAGGYPKRFSYTNADFSQNHLSIYLHYFSGDESDHSIINTPNSVYYQLMGEYGVLGMTLLLIFYFGYYLKRYKKLSYGLALVCLLAGAFTFEYWFEQLSIVIIFELLLFMDIKQSEEVKKESWEANQ